METRSVVSFQEDQRMQFWVMASDTRRISSVWAVAILLTHTLDRLDSFLRQRLEADPQAFRYRNDPNDVDAYAYHFTCTGGVRAAWPFEASFHRSLIDSIKRYIISQRSGHLWTVQENEMLLHVWEKVSDQLVLVAAQARIPARAPLVRDAVLFLLFLAVISISLNLLMADLLSSLIIAPLRILAEATEDVCNGNYGSRVVIRSADELEDVGESFNRMSEALLQRERLKRFVPSPLIQRLEHSTETNGIASAGSTEEVEVVVLASDIRGFTRLSETVSPDILVETLNRYFTLMQDAVTEQHGRVLKLIGDALLAVFLPDASGRTSVEAALRAAREMRRRLQDFNRQRASQGLFPIENGIGLAIGPALPIELGRSGSRKEFTLFGTPLSAAQALESLSARGTASRIVVSTEFADRLQLRPRCIAIANEDEHLPTGWELPEAEP